MADVPLTTAATGVTPVPLSVVIPAYDRETMIGRAVASAWSQRPRPPAEVIVVDDCSHDGTGAVAERLGARVIRHEVNRGLGASRNTGIAAATQPWIALLDSDDEWLPHLVDTLWRLRRDHVMVGLASLNCGPDPARDRYAGTTARRPVVLRSPAALLYPENFIAASGTMVRADVVAAVGGYREDLSHAEDLDLWLRVLQRGTGLVAPSIGVIYHLHGGQVTRDHAAMAARQLEVMRSYSDRPWWSAWRVEAWRAGSAWDLMRRGSPSNAWRCATFIASHPWRIGGLAGVLLRRHRLRRRSGAVTRRGTPTVTVVSPDRGLHDIVYRAAGPERLRAPRRAGVVASLAAQLRAPAGLTVVDSRAAALVARALGSRPVPAARLRELMDRPWSPAGL
jgi:glycosyltransferase involved in cell wall biosynthesis